MPDGDAVCHLTGDGVGSEGSTIMTALGEFVEGLLASTPTDDGRWNLGRRLASSLRED